MTSTDFNQLKRGREYRFCRVSQRDGARGSAGLASPDSDGKNDILNEQSYAA